MGERFQTVAATAELIGGKISAGGRGSVGEGTACKNLETPWAISQFTMKVVAKGPPFVLDSPRFTTTNTTRISVPF